MPHIKGLATKIATVTSGAAQKTAALPAGRWKITVDQDMYVEAGPQGTVAATASSWVMRLNSVFCVDIQQGDGISAIAVLTTGNVWAQADD